MDKKGFILIKKMLFSSEEGKATDWSLTDKTKQWIITQSKSFQEKGIEKISSSVSTYFYLVLTSQLQARSSILGNSVSVLDTQLVFKSMFKVIINEDCSINANVNRYQGALEQSLLKVDFSVVTGIYSLSIEKMVRYNNKILISNTWK